MKDEDRRFYMGWGAVIVMLGIAIFTWMMTHDSAYAGGVFLVGLGAFLSLVSFRPRFEMLLLGFGITLAIVGAIVLALVTTIIDPLYIVVAVLVALGLAIILFAAKREE